MNCPKLIALHVHDCTKLKCRVYAHELKQAYDQELKQAIAIAFSRHASWACHVLALQSGLRSTQSQTGHNISYYVYDNHYQYSMHDCCTHWHL